MLIVGLIIGSLMFVTADVLIRPTDLVTVSNMNIDLGVVKDWKDKVIEWKTQAQGNITYNRQLSNSNNDRLDLIEADLCNQGFQKYCK